MKLSINDGEIAIPCTSILDAARADGARAHAAMLESMIVKMLGHWVSELEPVVQICARTGLPIGLTAVGHTATYVSFVWSVADAQ